MSLSPASRAALAKNRAVHLGFCSVVVVKHGHVLQISGSADQMCSPGWQNQVVFVSISQDSLSISPSFGFLFLINFWSQSENRTSSNAPLYQSTPSNLLCISQKLHPLGMAPLSLLALPWLCPSLFALPLQPEAATRLHVSVSAWLLWQRDLLHGPTILGGLQHQGHLSGKGQMQVRIFSLFWKAHLDTSRIWRGTSVLSLTD